MDSNGGGMRMDSAAMSFSLMQSFKTGNPMIDMAVAVSIPSFIAFIMALFHNRILPQLKKIYTNLFFPVAKNDSVIRTINFEQNKGHSYFSGGSKGDRDERNNILQKALTMYIGSRFDHSDLQNANISLLATKEKGVCDSSTGWTTVYGNSAEQLKKYNVCTVPPRDHWVVVSGKKESPKEKKKNEKKKKKSKWQKIFFSLLTSSTKKDKLAAAAAAKEQPVIHFREGLNTDSENENDNKKKTSSSMSSSSVQTITFKFSCSAPDGGKVIDDYISNAFDWYTSKMSQTVDQKRYMYMKANEVWSLSNKDKGENEAFKRYVLSDRKTFNSLFFPEKENLLMLLDNFLEKKGKYQIPGYPDKLGVLLHGPPGTGKTSLIKALASRTKRSIVTINLSKIKTNQELMDIFFDQTFSVKDEQLPVKLGFKDVIFVMEDIDAASKIVHKRTPAAKQQPQKKKTKTSREEIITKTEEVGEDGIPIVTQLKRETSKTVIARTDSGSATDDVSSSSSSSEDSSSCSDSSDEKDAEKEEDEKNDCASDEEESESDKEEKKESDSKEKKKSNEKKKKKKLKTADGSRRKKKKTKTKKAIKAVPLAMSSKTDKLDLAGLLNVLDGVIDAPHRIIVMTTNHPDKLDEALIRPGRIDKKIYLGYLVKSQACSMVKHYFKVDLTAAQEKEIGLLMQRNKNITPAFFEQYCAEHEKLEDFLAGAAEHFKMKMSY